MLNRRRLLSLGTLTIVSILAGCLDDLEDDDLPGPEERLSRVEAAKYAETWTNRNFGDRDPEALEHYNEGTAAYRRGDYSRAMYELENAFEIYDELKDEAFVKRNEFDGDQPRQEFFSLVWNLYRLQHEATASWYNAAFAMQVNSDPVEAASWQQRAEDYDQQAGEVAFEYHSTLDELLEVEE